MRILRIFSDKIVQKVNFGQKMKKRKYIFKPIILNRFSLVNRVSSMRIFSNKIVQKLNFEQKIDLKFYMSFLSEALFTPRSLRRCPLVSVTY